MFTKLLKHEWRATRGMLGTLCLDRNRSKIPSPGGKVAERTRGRMRNGEMYRL